MGVEDTNKLSHSPLFPPSLPPSLIPSTDQGLQNTVPVVSETEEVYVVPAKEEDALYAQYQVINISHIHKYDIRYICIHACMHAPHTHTHTLTHSKIDEL